MNNMTVKILSGIGLTLACQAAFSGAITDIKVTSLSNQQKIIKIKFDRDLVEPKGFLSNNNTALTLDFKGSNVALAQPYLEYNDGILKSITAAEDGKRTRVALALGQASEFYTEKKADEIWVYVSGRQSKNMAPTTTTEDTVRTPAPIIIKETIIQNSSTDNAAGISTSPMQMTFNKGTKNSGRVVLSIPAGATAPDIKKTAFSLTINYANTPLPAADQKKLDTSELLTPVQSVSLERIGNSTQVVITNKGTWDYKQYPENGQYVFEIIPKTEMSESGTSPLDRKKNFKGNKVTLDFQNIEVRTVLQILAKESGMNIVASDTVAGSMTLNLKDVPWDQALDLVMQSQNLDMRKQGNIINIAPRDELFDRDKKTLAYDGELRTLGPLISQTYQLKYENVEEFKKILRIEDSGSSDRNSILSERGSALIDPATNTLIITDNAFIIKRFTALIEELDVPAQQVMIEARIVEARDDFLRQLGTKLNYEGRTGKWGGGGSSGDRIDWKNANGWIPSNNGMGIIRQGASSVVAFTLEAKQNEGQVKIISSPRVLTQDRKEAMIEKGTEIAYQEASSSGATSTSFKKAVLGLTVTPQITPDGNIIMDLNITKDSVSKIQSSKEGAPAIDTNRVKTQAMVENGGTLILGGIYEENNSQTETKVPLLGDIPLIGHLFKSTEKKRDKSELLIFITPRIVPNSNNTLRH